MQQKESNSNSRQSSRVKQTNSNIELNYPRYDDMKEGIAMEEKLNENFPKISLQAMPFRSYLDSTVTNTLIQALSALDKERPEDPVEYLAYFILSSKKQTE